MNEVIGKFLDSCKTISMKYSLLMRLQLFSYDFNQRELPNDAKWSALKNLNVARSSSQTITIAVSGSHS